MAGELAGGHRNFVGIVIISAVINRMSVRKTIEQQRQKVPGLTSKFYFNFGGQGPLPQAALTAIANAYYFLQEEGPFSQRANLWVQQQTEQLRSAIAEELGATPANITLTENVTAGCNIALWGINWQAGDRILLGDCEHPGVIAAVQEVSRRFGVEVATCPLEKTLNQGDPVAIIADSLTPNTRLLVISHLLWNTGQVLPLSEIVKICHDRPQPVSVLVDGAQSVGSLPLNLTELSVDYYAFTGHKWLCGPAGVGGLYISPAAFASLQPTFIGWRGINSDSQGQPSGWKSDGRRFEVATAAFPQYEGLRAAIAFHRQWGTPEERYDQILSLSQLLWQRLQQIDGVSCLKQSPPQAGLVSFQVDCIPHKQLVCELESQKFFLRTLAVPDCIRACTHYLTLPSEIERLAEAIKQLLAISALATNAS